MQIASRDAAAFASLSPEELALCVILVKLAFPAVWSEMVKSVENWQLVEYIGLRWFVDTSVQ